MPLEKKTKNKPDIYRVYQRQRMGSDAKSEPLTKEYFTDNVYNDKKSAIEWIKGQTDHGKIFIIRNRNGEMIDSYCWKQNRSVWDKINRTGYYGGYKIGNPHDPNGPSPSQCKLCSKPCSDPSHPSTKKIL